MSAVLVTPSPICEHDERTHCDSCYAELVLPSLQVLVCTWGTFKTALAGSIR